MVAWHDVEALAELVCALAEASGSERLPEPPSWNNFDLYWRKGVAQLDTIELGSCPAPVLTT